MAGFWAAIHLFQLALDLARQFSRWARRHRIRRRTRRNTLDELRLKSGSLLAKALAARNKFAVRGIRRTRLDDGSYSEQLHKDDGFRRD